MKEWNIADKDGNISVPDELDPLLNKLGFQIRFHTISGKNEIQTICDMVYIADKFYKEKIKSAIATCNKPNSFDLTLFREILGIE